ncbi:MSCRAMM family protein [Geoalkalibacter halelectricus]|uniref:Carboxypeptidase-like regulatory domain-containing protein n=1 Tax=Geoalkalibacter halelectricus TaxID=2847045 RepID=A0ABY5ZLR7_9BACT|nr:carboxypeptidase-like regulatory domain-containing protein [Geoalkalibacter halelectricus]MDO3378677.1 carboxypeptidase-like regulatory domain-containing protein [Geoalkalibacter halelectricus]UWZ80013.1 carboxypeptidase-like regulatory domain-containing protein [Geoalkalibacter halelectricus]
MKRALLLQSLLIALAMMLLNGCLPAAPPSETRHLTHYTEQDGKTGVTGQVLLRENAAPLQSAYVSLYPGAFSNLLGPPQFISGPTDAQGRYQIEDVPPGTYYVVARKRQSGQPTGPLSPGDYYSEHQRITTEVISGKLAVVDLPVVTIKAPMLFKRSVGEVRTDTGIRGKLTDAQGHPVSGSFAIAYEDADIKRAPDYASTLADQEGRFVLYLPKGGTYYLAARVHAWDMPRPGELYGMHGEDEPRPLDIADGQFIEDLHIVMKPFEGEYKPEKSRRPF